MYTTENTINDLLSNEFIEEHFEYLLPKFFLEMVPDELKNEPINTLSKRFKMPWGMPYISDEIVMAANALFDLRDKKIGRFVKLWETKTPENYFPTANGSKDDTSLLIVNDSFKEGRPIALIVPGGAYSMVSMSNEGLLIALELMKEGYAVAILRYRCAPNYYPEPQKDLALAIKYLRANEKASGVDVNDLMLVGFSAGGHLIATESCYADEIDKELMAELKESYPELYKKYNGISVKANKLCHGYAVTDLSEDEICYANIAGDDNSLRDKLSVYHHVDSTYPKSFLCACEDDELVPVSNTKDMYEALQKQGVESKQIIYPTGGHGFGVGVGTSAEGWIKEAVKYLK